MRRLLFFAVLLLPIALLGQDKPFNYKEFEGKVKKYINSQPDSVKILIERTLRQNNLNDTIKGNLFNIYGIYYGTVGLQDSAIVYYKKAIHHFKGYPKMMTRPMMNISTSYRYKGQFDKSFEYLDQALEIAKANKFRVYEAVIYGNYASNYNILQQYDKSVDYCLKSIEILKKENDPGSLVTSQQKLANNYMMMRNFEFAAEMYKDCLATYKKLNDDNNYYLTLLNYAECLNHLKDYDKALKVLDEAIVGLKKINNIQNLAVAYSKIGNIANLQKKYPKAVDSYDKAFTLLARNNSIYTTLIAAEYAELLNRVGNYKKTLEVMDCVKNLPVYKTSLAADKNRLDIAVAEAYGKTNDNEKALAGLQNAIAVKDSLNSIDNEKNAREVQAKFQAEVQREKNLALEANNRLLQHEKDENSITISICIAAVLAVIVLILLLLRSSILKGKLQQEQLGTAEADIKLLQEQHLYEQQLSNTQKDMINEKQRELTSTTLRMASFQNNINEVIQKCENNEIDNLPEIKKELRMLIKQQDYWKQFETRFNSLHPEFSATLQNRYSKLTKNDVEFCSLLKLNLSNKEIASLLQISHESAITKKYRIKKKMEISSDEEFEELLAAI